MVDVNHTTRAEAIAVADSWSCAAVAALVQCVVGDCAPTLPPLGIVLDLEPIAPVRLAGQRPEQAIALLESLPDEGYAIIGGDEAAAGRLAERSAAHVLRVGRNSGCDLVAENIVCGAGRLAFTCDATPYEVPGSGRHAVAWALAAIAVGQIGCLSSATIADRLANAVVPPGYGDVSTHAEIALVNNTAGGTLAAFRAGCDVFRSLAAQKRVVLCGERSIREMNAASLRLMGKEIVTRCGADALVVCGRQQEPIAEAAMLAGLPETGVHRAENFADAAALARRLLTPGDALLLEQGSFVAAQDVFATKPANVRAA